MSARSLLPAFALLLAALVLLASSVHAAPSLRYSWDECDPLVLNRDFSGPGHYTQTLSVTGLTQPLTSFQVSVVMGGGIEAWQFHDYGGCQGSSRLAVTTTAAGCGDVPGLAVTASMYPGLTDFRLHLAISGTAAAGPAPDPSARYVLARVDFDHSVSVAGPFAPPGSCAGGDYLQCFGIEYASLNGGAMGAPVLENGTLTWNCPSTPGVCPYRVPATATTWGRLKAIYR